MPELRLARPDDPAAVAGVHVRAWWAGHRGLLPDEYLDGLRAEDRARRHTFDLVGPEHPATTVALAAGQLCGFVTTGPARGPEANRGEIYALYVDPNTWGRGVGRTLLKHAPARLTDRGVTEALLWVLSGNEQAERFYRADGWAGDGGRREDDVWGIRIDALHYRRVLT